MPERAERWNDKVLFGQSTAMHAARQLSSPHIVLPFLFVAAGGPVGLGILIVPIVEIFRMLGYAATAPVIHAAAIRKWYLIAFLLASGASLALVAIATQTASVGLLVALYLLAAVSLGLSMAAGWLTHHDLLAKIVSASERDRIVYSHLVAAGLLAIAVALACHHLWRAGAPMERQLALLWSGAIVFVISAALLAVVREQAGPGPAPRADHGDPEWPRPRALLLARLKTGALKALEERWVQQLLVARVLFLSVELALPFYAVHAAVYHRHEGASLTVFLIVTSVAMIVGGLMWRTMLPSSSCTVMVAGVALAATGGVLALIIEAFPPFHLLPLHALVLFLVALGAVSVAAARTLYLTRIAPECERPYFLAVASVCTGAAAIPIAALLGLMVHVTGFAVPICFLIAFNVIAGLWAAWLPAERAQLERRLELARAE